MNVRSILRLLGRALCLEGMLMLVPLALSLAERGTDALGLALSAALTLAAGMALSALHQHKQRALSIREGYAGVAVIWLVLSAFGALPYMLSGVLPGFFDAYFETVSGLTTTGSSVLTSVDAVPRGILFWRGLTNWMGGLGILVFALALFSQMGSGALHLLRAESPGPMPGKLLPKLGHTAKAMCIIYLGLTVLLTVLLVLLGMPLFDAVVHTFATVATGGFSTRGDSIAAYHSPAIEVTLGIFMLLSGVNFSLYFLVAQGNIKKALRNGELRLYGILALTATLLVTLNIWNRYDGFGTSLRHAFFQVSTMMTTTGFSTQDFAQWPEFSQVLLMLICVIGGCAGSTSGGYKVVRLLLLGKIMRRETGHIMHPRMVRSIKLDGKAMEGEVVVAILVYTVTLLTLLLIGWLVVALDGHDFTTTLSAVITCVANTGPGLGRVGPMGNFALFSPWCKAVLSLLMLFGRLEIYPMLLLLSLLLRRRRAGGFA